MKQSLEISGHLWISCIIQDGRWSTGNVYNSILGKRRLHVKLIKRGKEHLFSLKILFSEKNIPKNLHLSAKLNSTASKIFRIFKKFFWDKYFLFSKNIEKWIGILGIKWICAIIFKKPDGSLLTGSPLIVSKLSSLELSSLGITSLSSSEIR